MPGSFSCQKLHYSPPNGFHCLKQISGRAPSKSELQTGESEGGQERPSRYMTHSQTMDRAHYGKLSEINDNPSHVRWAVLVQQCFFISRTERGRSCIDGCGLITQLYRFCPHPLKTAHKDKLEELYLLACMAQI